MEWMRSDGGHESHMSVSSATGILHSAQNNFVFHVAIQTGNVANGLAIEGKDDSLNIKVY